MSDKVIVLAPYAKFKINKLIFNSNGYRHCSEEEVEMLMKVPQRIAKFKLKDGTIINSKKYRDIIKKQK